MAACCCLRLLNLVLFGILRLDSLTGRRVTFHCTLGGVRGVRGVAWRGVACVAMPIGLLELIAVAQASKGLRLSGHGRASSDPEHY
eukprot:SAG31_NODE_123_length_23712_cov_41.426291_25_plen_86_part_00